MASVNAIMVLFSRPYALKPRCLDVCHWQPVFQDALHSVRSLLCTATNETPHEQMLSFKRRSTFGTSVPTWLSLPGPVYLKCHTCTNTTL